MTYKELRERGVSHRAAYLLWIHRVALDGIREFRGDFGCVGRAAWAMVHGCGPTTLAELGRLAGGWTEAQAAKTHAVAAVVAELKSRCQHYAKGRCRLSGCQRRAAPLGGAGEPSCLYRDAVRLIEASQCPARTPS
jgi:hypothetical protein